MKQIAYRAGYKYQLARPYSVEIEIKPETNVWTDYIRLATNGVLTIEHGYSWDGPSGPAIDTKNFMRGSLVHDALYQLMRGGYIDRTHARNTADQILKRICREDGMSALRAQWVYLGVRIGGALSADPESERPVISAP